MITICKTGRDSEVTIRLSHRNGLAEYSVEYVDANNHTVNLQQLSPVATWNLLLTMSTSMNPTYKVPNRVLLELADDVIKSFAAVISSSVLDGEE
jgi:hypothetical protein